MDLPTMLASSYSSSTMDPALLFKEPPQNKEAIAALMGQLERRPQHVFNAIQAAPLAAPAIAQEKPMSARIIKVYIADANENLPLESRVLYSGDEKLTDLTDQELFFEVPIADLLAKHNEVRAKTIDKKQAEKFGRDIFLEPVRIRDLKMVVVTVAAF